METLFQETLKRNPECWIAHYNLGVVIGETPGRTEEAIQHYREAARLKPAMPWRTTIWLLALSQTPDRLPEAIEEYRAALRFDPGSAGRTTLGLALSKIPGGCPRPSQSTRQPCASTRIPQRRTTIWGSPCC